MADEAALRLSLIPMRKKLRIANTDFLLLALMAGVATVIDIESTVHAQHHPEATEINSWIYGERPGRVRMYAINIPVTASLTGLAYSWKRQCSRGSTRWVWCAPLMAVAIGHGVAAIANYVNFPRRTQVGLVDEA